MVVAVKNVGNDVIEAVSAAMDEASFQDFIPRGSIVFLKVNLGWDMFIPGSVTNPAVFLGVVRKLKGYASKIAVVESDQVLENIEKAYFKSRISEIAAKEGVEWINLSQGEKIYKKVPGNKIIKEVPVPKILTEGTIVTLPVMKTHDKTAVTLSLKNQWGCIPKMRHMYHLHLTEAISDVNAALGVKFSVLDGTIAMEGNAPKTGHPREVGIIGAGGDLVEVDSVFTKLMGFDPFTNPHLLEAQTRGLGKIGIEYIGDIIKPIRPFEPAGHNLVSRVELFFRTSFLSGLVFKTPLFMVMLLGAKLYYHIFEAFQGRSIREHYRRHPIYGKYFDEPEP
ncbi:MAG: DUF362 domain-containing protein [Planctomycetota bacterium]